MHNYLTVIFAPDLPSHLLNFSISLILSMPSYSINISSPSQSSLPSSSHLVFLSSPSFSSIPSPLLMDFQISLIASLPDKQPQYSFQEGIYAAKESGNSMVQVLKFLSRVSQEPVATECIRQIDDNGNFKFYHDADSTALMIACCNDHIEMVKLLLLNNANPNIQNGRKYNALMYATRNNNIFQLLLDHQVEICAANVFNETALYWACLVGNVKVVDMLLKKDCSLINVRKYDGRTPLLCSQL